MSSRLDKATASLDVLLATLQTSADAVSMKLQALLDDGEYDDKLASHNCYLANAAAQVCRELRQLEKHSTTMDASLTDDELLAEMAERLAELPLEKRRAFEKSVKAMNKKKVT